MPRCPWSDSSELMRAYHDEEWGVPCHDDRLLLEGIILDGAQAGLSWSTILNKRENYRRAFHRWDAKKIARYGDADVARLMADAGIVRNRMKIAAAIANARAYLAVIEDVGSFDRFIWQFVDGKPIVNRYRELADLPAKTPESIAMSKELLRRRFKFVGPTICYAFMQARGMVNDHLIPCDRHAACAALA